MSEGSADWLRRLFALDGKTALVTGGAAGIGRAMTEALAMAGARVIIASRDGEACRTYAAELNARLGRTAVEGLTADLGAESGALGLAEAVRERTDLLHILVNNAGRTWGAPLGAFPHSAWARVLEVNLAAPFTLTQALLPLLRAAAAREDPARIVNLGSCMAIEPMGYGAYSYAASKAAVHHLTRILARELAGDFITVNAFAPGAFESRMTAYAIADDDARERVADAVPLGRMGSDDDIAGAVLFLCGRAGSFCTGGVIPLDGGISIDGGRDVLADSLERTAG